LRGAFGFVWITTNAPPATDRAISTVRSRCIASVWNDQRTRTPALVSIMLVTTVGAVVGDAVAGSLTVTTASATHASPAPMRTRARRVHRSLLRRIPSLPGCARTVSRSRPIRSLLDRSEGEVRELGEGVPKSRDHRASVPGLGVSNGYIASCGPGEEAVRLVAAGNPSIRARSTWQGES